MYMPRFGAAKMVDRSKRNTKSCMEDSSSELDEPMDCVSKRGLMVSDTTRQNWHSYQADLQR